MDLAEENEIDLTGRPTLQPLASLADASPVLFVDTSAPAAPVVLWDEGQFTPFAPGLADFLARLKPRSARPTLPFLENAYRMSFAKIPVAEKVGILDGVLVGLPEPTEKGLRDAYRTAVANCFSARGGHRIEMGDRAGVLDLRAGVAWGAKTKEGPDWRFLSLVDNLTFELAEFEAAAAAATEALALRKVGDRDNHEFYLYKALGYAHLRLGQVTPATLAYRRVWEAVRGSEERTKEVLEDLDKAIAASKDPSLALATALHASFKTAVWTVPTS